jgi:DNA-directed RNA polymerase I, II, and III subunit RPABC2
MGAPPLIMTTAKSPIEIAEEELKEKVLPITIRRKLPDGRYQDIPIKWLLE